MESCDEWSETCLPMVRTIVFMVPISRRVSPTVKGQRESGVVSKAVSRRDSVLARLICQHFVIESRIRFCVQIGGRRKIKHKTETGDSGNCALMVRLKPITSGFRFFSVAHADLPTLSFAFRQANSLRFLPFRSSAQL